MSEDFRYLGSYLEIIWKNMDCLAEN
jgi:hypothetical protein